MFRGSLVWARPGREGTSYPRGWPSKGEEPLAVGGVGAAHILVLHFPPCYPLLFCHGESRCWASQARVFLCVPSGERGGMVPSVHGSGLSTSQTPRVCLTCPKILNSWRPEGSACFLHSPGPGRPAHSGASPSCCLQLSPGVSAQLTGGPITLQ